MLLLVGGVGFVYYTYKQNYADPIWVPLPLKAEVSVEKRDQIARDLKAKLGEREVLVKVSQDLGLARKWQVVSDEEAAKELGKRLFVKPGEVDTPLGKVPSLNIGVTGKHKERDVSGEISVRLMDDVWKILGIKPPPQQAP